MLAEILQHGMHLLSLNGVVIIQYQEKISSILQEFVDQIRQQDILGNQLGGMQ